MFTVYGDEISGSVSNLLFIFLRGALRAPLKKINNRSRTLPNIAALLAIVPLAAAAIIAARTKADEPSTDVKLRNPIELGSALGYGAVFAVLFILIRAVEAWFGDAGIYFLAAISGVTDVDAVSLSLAQATKGDLPLLVGSTGILIAASVNTVVKAVLATVIGGWNLARWCASILLLALGLSFVAAFFTSF
jgi:uncharacterized membrane protein (DUF4010 family)